MKKKILGIILAILMISAIIPMAAFADAPAFAVNGVAKDTLADALNAAQKGDIVEINQAGEYTVQSLPGSGYTVEAKVDGVVFNRTAGYGSYLTGANSGITLKNITWNIGTANYQYMRGLTLDGCTINGRGCYQEGLYAVNTTFLQDAAGGDYHVWTYEGNCTFEKCTFINSVSGKFINVYTDGCAASVIVKDCTFINQGKESKAALNVKETRSGAPLNLDVTIEGTNVIVGNFPAASESDTLTVLNGLVQVDDKLAKPTEKGSETTVVCDNAKLAVMTVGDYNEAAAKGDEELAKAVTAAAKDMDVEYETPGVLDPVKNAAIADLQAYIEELGIVDDSFAAAEIKKIKAAEDEDSIKAALAEAKAAADVQKAAEVEAAKALAAAKEDAMKEIDALVVTSDDAKTFIKNLKNSDSSINAATTVEAVAEAKANALTNIASMEKALADAKAAAIEAIDTAVNGDTAENVVAAAEAAKAAIEAATNTTAVAEAQEAGVSTIAATQEANAQAAAALKAAKEAAVAEFNAYVKAKGIADTSFAAAELEKINAAEDTDAVAAALAAAKAAADKQKAIEVAEAAARAFQAQKDAAIEDLRAYAEHKGIKDTYPLEQAIREIENAKTVDQINVAYESGKLAIDDQYSLEHMSDNPTKCPFLNFCVKVLKFIFFWVD